MNLSETLAILKTEGLLDRCHRIKAGDVEVELSQRVALPPMPADDDENVDVIVDKDTNEAEQLAAIYGAGAGGWYPGADATS